MLDCLVEDGVFFLFQFPISHIGSGKPCRSGHQGFLLGTDWTISYGFYTQLGPLLKRGSSIVQDRLYPWVGNLTQVILYVTFRETIVKTTQEVSDRIILAFLILQ